MKHLLLEEGLNSNLTDTQILSVFRHCSDCGSELVSADQQMHAILEFDSPEQAFLATYETLDTDGCGPGKLPPEEADEDVDTDSNDQAPYQLIRPQDVLDLLPGSDIDSECTCGGVPNHISAEGVFDGAENLYQAIEMLRAYANYLEHLSDSGYELCDTVIDDIGIIEEQID